MAIVGRLSDEVAHKIHPEVLVDNFSQIDCDLTYFSLVRGIMLRQGSKSILDYGAGRNAYITDFSSEKHSYLIRDLRNLKATGASVTAVDVAKAVLDHPTSDQQLVIDPAKALPFEYESFDLIVSYYVFEHVENAAQVAAELQRVLKRGGWLAIRTPNSRGYLKLASALVPNKLLDAVLKFVQPHRKTVDTFPTYYRLNSLKEMRKHFDQCEVVGLTDSWEPAYFFGKGGYIVVFSLYIGFCRALWEQLTFSLASEWNDWSEDQPWACGFKKRTDLNDSTK